MKTLEQYLDDIHKAKCKRRNEFIWNDWDGKKTIHHPSIDPTFDQDISFTDYFEMMVLQLNPMFGISTPVHEVTP